MQTSDENNEIIRGLIVDPVPNSPNGFHLNCKADIKKNYKRDLGNETVDVHGFERSTQQYRFSLSTIKVNQGERQSFYFI